MPRPVQKTMDMMTVLAASGPPPTAPSRIDIPVKVERDAQA